MSKKELDINQIIKISDLNIWLNSSHVLKDIYLSFKEKMITGIIGPSGGGKTTLLRSINRINDTTPGFKIKGSILFEGKDIYSPTIILHQLRQRIGMIFQKPCVLPRSIYENVIFGIKMTKRKKKKVLKMIAEEKLMDANLWDEVKDRLSHSAIGLSLGQQQRLCIARALAVEPKVILMDEPTSSLDPISSLAIEDMILKLKERYTVIVVTHNINQAYKISDYVVFISDGRVIENGIKEEFFNNPRDDATQRYICCSSNDYWKKKA